MDINFDSYFWQYLSQSQKDLLLEGQFLLDKIIKEGKYNFKDYSFLVFPFAKAYEGFLKKIFLDVKFISHLDYISDHYRLGKVLSPNLINKLGDRSVYQKIVNFAGSDLAEKIWNAWKIGRNQVFHYFPHNLKSLTFPEAEEVIGEIIKTMEEAIVCLKIEVVKERLKTI
jgi:hypothetical protein